MKYFPCSLTFSVFFFAKYMYYSICYVYYIICVCMLRMLIYFFGHALSSADCHGQVYLCMIFLHAEALQITESSDLDPKEIESQIK